MPSVAGIKAKLDSVLRRFTITDRDVYIRRSMQGGGDPLTGRGVGTTNNEVLMDPQPSVTVAAKNYPLVIAGTSLSPDAEYLLTVSATAMTLSDVTDPNLSILFRDALGKDEVFFICGFSTMFLKGEDIGFNLILCSKKR
jgi:hypothetical protein